MAASATDATIDDLITAGRRLVRSIGIYRANNGTGHAVVHSSTEVIEASEAMAEAIDAAEAARALA
jgi:hypothetical protein